MAPAPALNIPSSRNTVDVSIINTNACVYGLPASVMMSPPIKGHDWLNGAVYSFLIEHSSDSSTPNSPPRRLLFDLGIRKDILTIPAIAAQVAHLSATLDIKDSVPEILSAHSIISPSQPPIEALIWSHWHMDHAGDPAELSSSTALIVGPGFKSKMLPGYPGNPEATFLEADYADRPFHELDFISDPRAGFKIGQFNALDYFGDGSFYLLDSPGHAVGHICALARVTSNPASFIFMGGDAAHHAGEFRPSPQHPLPNGEIRPNPFGSAHTGVCLGELFSSLLLSGPTKPFYNPAEGPIHHDVPEATRTIEKMQEFDGQSDENILVVIAHDETLLDVVDFFPKKANDFMQKGWVQQSRWRFLRDFAGAVGEEEVQRGLRQWGPRS